MKLKTVTELTETNDRSLDHELAYQGWFESHPSLRPAVLPDGAQLQAFIGVNWPMSAGADHRLNPLWLMQVTSLDLLLTRAHWLVRDGLLGLIWFFRRYQAPPNGPVKLLIDEDLIHVVPLSWRSHVGTYRVHSTSICAADSRLALLGLAVESYLSIRCLKTQLSTIMETLKKSSLRSDPTVDLFLPARNISDDEREQAYHPAYFAELFDWLNGNLRATTVRPLSYSEMTGTFDAPKLNVWDLNEKLMIADNALVHDLLRRGASWGLTSEIKAGEDFQKISPYHGYTIRWESKGAIHEREFDDVFSSRTFQQLPWPEWFGARASK